MLNFQKDFFFLWKTFQDRFPLTSFEKDEKLIKKYNKFMFFILSVNQIFFTGNFRVYCFS